MDLVVNPFYNLEVLYVTLVLLAPNSKPGTHFPQRVFTWSQVTQQQQKITNNNKETRCQNTQETDNKCPLPDF